MNQKGNTTFRLGITLRLLWEINVVRCPSIMVGATRAKNFTMEAAVDMPSGTARIDCTVAANLINLLNYDRTTSKDYGRW